MDVSSATVDISTVNGKWGEMIPVAPQESVLPSSVDISKAELESKTWWYEIMYGDSVGQVSSIRRRYSEFEKLRTDINERDSEVLQVVEGKSQNSMGIQISPQPFPTTAWRQSSKVIEKRKLALSGWFNALLPNDSIAPLLASFLALDQTDSKRRTYGAAPETTELQLSIKVVRWLYVKEKKGGKQFVAYEFEVTGPFQAGRATHTYYQRWSEFDQLRIKFERWSRKTAKVHNTEYAFSQMIPSKNTKATDDPKRLDSRKEELHVWAVNLCEWANEVAVKRVIDLDTLVSEVIEPCFGEDRGGKSPTGRRSVENVEQEDQEKAGWLNFVRKSNKSEPYHVVLAKVGVEVGSMEGVARGDRSQWEGDEKGTLAMFHGPRERFAHDAIPLSGRFFAPVSQVAFDDKGSPRAMRGMYQFAVQWHEQTQPDRDGATYLQLQKWTLSTSDAGSASEWVRKCRAVQRRHFSDWNAEELSMWLQATGVFATDEPMMDCGVFAYAVEDFVRKDDRDGLRRSFSVPPQKGKFDDLWELLYGLLEADLGEAEQQDDTTEMRERGDSAISISGPLAQEPPEAHISPQQQELIDQFVSVTQSDSEAARDWLTKDNWDVHVAVEHYFATLVEKPDATGSDGYYAQPLEETQDKPRPIPATRKAEAKAATDVLCKKGGWVDGLKGSMTANWGWVPEWSELHRIYKAHSPTKLRELPTLVDQYGGETLLKEASKKYERKSAQSWLLQQGFSAAEVYQIRNRVEERNMRFDTEAFAGMSAEDIRRDVINRDADEWSDSSDEEDLFKQ